MKSSEDGLIRLIAIFKLLKAGLLIALGIGLFKLLTKTSVTRLRWRDQCVQHKNEREKSALRQGTTGGLILLRATAPAVS